MLVTAEDEARITFEDDLVSRRRRYRPGVTRAPGRLASTPRRRRIFDFVVAGLLALLVLASDLVPAEAGSASTWVRMVLGLAATVPLVWRRRAPVAVWAITGMAALLAMVEHGSPGVLALGPLVALYTVALTSPRRVSLAAVGVTIVGVTIGVVAGRPQRIAWDSFIFPVVVVAAAWLIGDNLRVRRAYIAELEAAAARTRAERAAEAAMAASQERARIARELHDVVAHHISVIAVQAGAARMVAEQRGDDAHDWEAMEAMARQALGEMRQLLGVLRHDGESPATGPSPGLGQLDRLIADVRQAGLPVVARVQGRPAALPAAVDLSAYRIVQEALTNVLKHGGRVPTTVVVRYGVHDVELEIADEGPAMSPSPRATAIGHGLVGMRERVTMLGGELEAGPRPDGGFVVAARLPLATTAP